MMTLRSCPSHTQSLSTKVVNSMSASKHTSPPPQILSPGRSMASPAELTILPGPDYEQLSASREYVPLSAYWYILFRRRWTIAAVALILTAIVAAVSFWMTPIYKATARVEVEPETSQVGCRRRLLANSNPGSSE